MMDEDIDSDEDNEGQLNDLKHLTAVLEIDEASTSDSISRCSASVASTANSTVPTVTNELSKIESALALNKLYDEKLGRLETVLGARLRDCRNKLKEIQVLGPNAEKQEVFRYINCGKPYFRDKANFPAPDNDDTIVAKSQMYDFSHIMCIPGWTVNDKSQFISVIYTMSQNLKQTELQSKIADLKRQNKVNPSKAILKEIASLEKEIEKVKKKHLNQLALPLDKEYDWDTLANKLNRRHTAQEYQALWKLFFHPSINKNSWSKDEHSSLQTIVTEYNHQDWDAIAEKLGTGRTGYQCFVYYRTNMSVGSLGQKWSNEEVIYLKRLVEYFKHDNYIPWGKIAAAMENRSKIQIYNKYLRLIEQRKGRFLPEEDAVILNCVEKFGPNFKKMTDYLPGRSMGQLRVRYQVISNMRISTVWSVDDDRKLIQIMSNQNCDANFSEASQYFPGKTRINVRSRYMTLTKWMKRYPHLDIKHAPRRGARRLNHGHVTEDLNKAIENLKNTLKTEADLKKRKKKISKNCSEVEIEDAIITTLINEKIKEDEYKRNALYDAEGNVFFGYDEVTAQDELNLNNLNKCLIFLQSKLQKQKYDESDYSKQYPGLGESENETCTVHVKSYSRKDTVQTINVSGGPSVWGDCVLSPRTYVLPPHYATITGCRALMASIGTKCQNFNISSLLKKNSIFKQHFNDLVERFYTLFLWPMLLSNDGPRKQKPPQRIETFKKPSLACNTAAAALATYVRCNKKYTMDSGNGIDLKEECEDKSQISLSENMTLFPVKNVY